MGAHFETEKGQARADNASASATPDDGPTIFAQSTFDTDAEGWTVQLGYPEASATHDPAWQKKPTGFSTGIIIWSTAMDASETSEVFFKAPADYTGDLSGCYDQTFDFEIALELGVGSEPASFYAGPQGLILQSAAGDLWLPAAVQDTYDNPEIDPIQSLAVTLHETAECRFSTTGNAPSEAEFKAVLAGVTAVLLRIAWYPGQEMWKTVAGAVTLYADQSGALDPKLEALKERLTAAITDDQLTLDATTLGDDGTGIVTLIQSAFGTESLAISGHVALTAQSDTLLLTADALQDTILGISQTPVSAVFGIIPAGLTIQFQFGCGSGWDIGVSFPTLANSWAGTIAVIAETDNDASFILASQAAPLTSDETVMVAEGLNLMAKLDTANGPATALTSLITGVPGSVSAIGPAEGKSDATSFNIRGGVPDFQLTLPFLPTLDFISPYVAAAADYGGAGPEPIYNAYIEAGAEVSIGTSSLPLAVQVPTTVFGWRFGLMPGHAVPISDLATFLGEFTGLTLLSSLPQEVQLLSKFEIRNFMVQLNEARNDFLAIYLGFGTVIGEGSENNWTIIPGAGSTPILALEDLSFNLAISKRSQGTYITGSVIGSFSLSDTLSLQAQIPIPVSQGLWVLSANSDAPLPNLVDFARFLGGQSLADLMPTGLGALTSYVLDDLTFMYDPQAKSLTNISLGLSAAQNWVIIDGQLEIQNFALQGALANPLSGSSALTGRVSGTIEIASTVDIDVTVSRSSAAASWRLSVFTEEIALPSLGDLTRLAGGDITPDVPDTLSSNHFSLSDIELDVDITNKKLQKFFFTLDTKDTWPIITDILSVTEAGVTLNLDWTGTDGNRQVTGFIWGNVAFCEADFWLLAAKETDGWTLSVTLLEGSQLTLEALVNAFDASLWSDLQSLGVPNITLTEAGVTYQTASGDYSFSGTITAGDQNKWTIPIGITDISIESLGGAVTCTRESDGTATDKKVYVTGAFSVGSVGFTVKYLAGDNLTIDCTLVGSDPVSVAHLVDNLCSPDAGTVTWVAGFEALDAIEISDASAQLVLGSAPSFELSGKITIEEVEVDVFFIAKEINQKWEFALGVAVSADWTMSGFTDVFAAFNIDKATWIVVASSFSETGFEFPPIFPTPAIAVIDRGLDFYGTFSIDNTIDTIHGVTTVLPDGTIQGTELTIHGLLTDPLDKSYLEVILVADPDGVPLMGWDAVRLAMFSLRLTAEPSFALHGDFIFKSIKNPDGSVFHLILDLAVSMTEVQITFEQQPDQGAIFTWQDAFGITSLEISLTDLALGIIFEGPAFDGTIGGSVSFEHQDSPPNSVMKNAVPSPVHVVLMEMKRARRATLMPDIYGTHREIDYRRPYDQDGILIAMKVSFVILAEEPVPVPYELAGHFVNFTLPYILKRFANIDIPSILLPIQFPDVQFDFRLPNPLSPGSDQDLQFTFKGDIVIFGIAGSIDAEFDETRIKFIANMDPLIFAVDGTTILAITKTEGDDTHGPDIAIDSKPDPGDPNIGGHFECAFFDGFLGFGGAVQIKVDTTDPAKSLFYFHFAGHVGSLADLILTLTYQEANYMAVDAGFHLGLTTDNLPGFSHNGVEVAEAIDLSKYKGPQGIGVVLIAEADIKLDARNPVDPDFTMHIEGYIDLELTDDCKFKLDLSFDMDVNKDSMASIPLKVVEQMATNTANIFGALITSAGCFKALLELGLLVLEETAKVALVLSEIFATGIDLGADILNDLGHAAEGVAHALWNIFSSHDTKKNTKAMKGAGYNSDETGEAVKKAADQGGSPYTAQDLVHDQASAGYSAPQVAGGLNTAFTNYNDKPVDAGQLLANQSLTSFTSVNVASALRHQYGSATGNAEAMFGLLNQVYTGGSALGPQDMANALAPLYPAVEVAQVLRNHYPSDTATAEAMAGYLLTAYQAAGTPLDAPTLAGALAPLYAIGEVATTLHTHFGSETDTALKLGTLLKTAYASVTPAIDASAMADALASIFTPASSIVTALQSLYASDTDTAMKMAGLLFNAYENLSVGDMAAALAAGSYPTEDIAAALKHYYQTEAGTPEKMAALLAAQHYTPVEVSPVLKTLFPDETQTAGEMVGYLQSGFGAGTIDAAGMAAALAKSPYTPVESAPALKTAYGSDTATASALATLLITAYQDGEGANTITAAVMGQALSVAPYDAGGDGGTAKALIANYATDTAQALQMSQLLKQAPYTAADIGPVLTADYASETATAGEFAAIFAATPFDAPVAAPVIKSLYVETVATAAAMYGVLNGAYTSPVLTAPQMAGALAASPYAIADTAPVLKQHYASATGTAEEMYGLLSGAYTDPVSSTQDMATALAKSPYDAVVVAPVLKAHYGTDAGTASGLATLLKAAYANPAIDLATMLAALTATSFNAYNMAPTVKPLYTPAVEDMGHDLAAALADAAPISSIQLGIALTSAAYDSSDTAKGVMAGVPDTPAGVMAAVLLVAAESTLTPALQSAAQYRQDGDDVATASPKVAQAVSGVTGMVLTTVLNSVFTPPNLTAQPLANAVVGGFETPDATSVATGLLITFPATDAATLISYLQQAYQAAGKDLSPADGAAAVASAFKYIGAALSQNDFATMMVAAYGAAATPDEVAAALVGGYGADATPTSMIAALQAGFADTSIVMDARVASVAIQKALSLSPTEADKLAEPLASGFDLTRVPNDVGVLSVALKVAAFSLNATSAALSAYFGAQWTPAAFKIVGSVYTEPQWDTAVSQRVAGNTIEQAAPAIYAAQADTDAALMVQVLAAVYDLTQTVSAITPMANALKAVTTGGQKVYSLNEASAAMQAQYTPDWTPEDWRQFTEIYNAD